MFTACVKEITLTPYELPDLVEAFIRKVECFDESNAMLVASDEGVMLIYDEDHQVLYNASSFGFLNSINWDQSLVLYAPKTEIFWVIDDTTYYRFGRTLIDFHVDKTQFYAPTKAYYAYAVSPDGDLYRSGYYKEYWDPNSGSFYSDYYIGVYQYVGNPNNTWIEHQTNMFINSEYLSKPVFLFKDNGDMVFNTNPTFVVSNLNHAETQFTSYEKTGIGFKFKTSFRPYLHDNATVYGLDAAPGVLVPASGIYYGDITSPDVAARVFAENCNMPENNNGVVKCLDWKNGVARLYVRNFTNSLSSDKSALGYIMEYDLGTDNCSVKTLKSDTALKFSESIEDLDVYRGNVYIGTRNGLMVYDLSTDHLNSYLLNLLDEKKR